MSSADRFANYDKQTYQGIEQMEQRQLVQFADTYLSGSPRVKSELTSALRTAGLKLESDGKSLKLSLIEDPSESLTMSKENPVKAEGASPYVLRGQMMMKVLERPEVRGA